MREPGNRPPGEKPTRVTVTDMRRDAQELRRALERLFEELYATTHALNQLSERVCTSFGTYRAHGAPFGRSRTAVRIWMTYRQFTTPN